MPVISQKKKWAKKEVKTNVAKSFFNSIREQNWAEKIKTDPEWFHGAKESLLRKADSSSCPAPSFPRVTLAAFGNLIYPAIISQWQEVEMLDEISNSLSCNLTSSVCVWASVCVRATSLPFPGQSLSSSTKPRKPAMRCDLQYHNFIRKIKFFISQLCHAWSI